MGSCQGQLNPMVSSTPSVNNLDTLDIDQYINFDPSPIPSTPSYSPAPSQSTSTQTPGPHNEYANDLLLAPSTQQTFAGPSHQYELHKQQTGLPVGALANTLAVNQSDHIVYGHAQRMFDVSTDSYFGTNTTEDIFDFNAAPSQHLATDMDIDFASPLYDTTADYINPVAIGGQESSTTGLPPKQRAWPGMHQQQAALAKEQARAQQERQRPSVKQQNDPSSRQPSLRAPSNAAPAKDPIVEERISRLLNQMRHSSVTSSNDDASTPTANSGPSSLGRSKKDEEDMDEDERLLASEEGKKLTSKERRQLRNKVSARAFRSRRKEYIGQLEGEIAAKTAEANDLRAKNQELMSENHRLTDLTRMLLESPAFNSFLNELSGTDGQVATSSASSQQNAPAPKVEEAQPEPRKDVNPHQPSPQVQSDQRSAQVGMALIPETYHNLNPINTTWTDNVDSSLYDAQVYTVTSMPEGPAIDQYNTGWLSGKFTGSVGSFVSDESKQDTPAIEHLCPRYEEAKSEVPLIGGPNPFNARFDNSDSTFGIDCSASPLSHSSANQSKKPSHSCVQSERTMDPSGLTTVENRKETDGVGVASMERFKRFCAIMEGPSQRVAAVTAHLR
ncbi:MAG: hypothetical protein Q9216_004582 [Gyalolechia sp. 2 TL-2023]